MMDTPKGTEQFALMAAVHFLPYGRISISYRCTLSAFAHVSSFVTLSSPLYGTLLSGILFIMKLESIAALLAVSVQAVDALSTLSTRVGVSTTTLTATSFETATSTITSVAEITSVATTCAVGSTAPAGQLLLSCTESVWSAGGSFFQQHCSAALVGGTAIRAYVLPYPQGASVALSFCTALNNLHVPASSCAGVNIMSIGGYQQAFLLNGDVTLTSTSSLSRVIQPFATNPCEITATITTTASSEATETSTVVYTSSYEVSYLETITVSIPEPTTSSTLTSSTLTSSTAISSNSTLSSSTVPVNSSSSAPASTFASCPANSSSTLSVLTLSNTSTVAPILSTPSASANATTLTVVPVHVNATSTFPSITVSTISPIGNTTIASAPTSNITSSLLLPSSVIAVPAFNTSISAIRPTSNLSSPIFLNTTSSSSQLSPVTSNAPVVTAVPTPPVSLSTQALPASISSESSEKPITLTKFTTNVYTVTACPPAVTNCLASQKTTFLTTQTIVDYSTALAATSTLDAQVSSAQPLGPEPSAEDEGSKIEYNTSTLYSTSTQTVTACPSSVKNCPALEKTVYYTEVVSAYTTVCPVSTVAASIPSLATHNGQATRALKSGSASTSAQVTVETAYTTSIVYTTLIRAVTTCPSNVRDCPASEKTIYFTDVVKAYTTVCPVTAESSTGSVPFATSTTVSSSWAKSISAAAGERPSADAESAQSGIENTPAVPTITAASSLKSTLGADSATLLTATGTWTYIAGGKILTSTRGFPVVSVVASSPTSVIAETATAVPSVMSGSPVMEPSRYSNSQAVSDVASTGSSSKPITTAGVLPHNNSTLVAASSSTKHNASPSAVSGIPTLALYTGSASISTPRTLSVVPAVICVLLGLVLTM